MATAAAMPSSSTGIVGGTFGGHAAKAVGGGLFESLSATASIPCVSSPVPARSVDRQLPQPSSEPTVIVPAGRTSAASSSGGWRQLPHPSSDTAAIVPGERASGTSSAGSWRPPFPSSPGMANSRTSLQSSGSAPQLAQKVPARLLAELREAQGASEMEARLLAGLTDLFEELAGDERRRRSTWEDRAERAHRELRASVDADLARGACESRKLLAEAKRDAGEAKKLAQPCHDLLSGLDRQEVPPALVQLVQREVKSVTTAESARLMQALSAQVSDAVNAACAEQMAHFSKGVEALEKRLAEAESRAVVSREAFEQRLADVEARSNVSQEEIKVATDEVENRLVARLRDLREAHTTLQATLDKYADKWESALREEVEVRAQGDAETAQRLELVVRACEAQHRSLEASLRRVGSEAQRTAGSAERNVAELRAQVRTAAELEATARQESDNQLQMGLRASDAELRALRGELQHEASTRAHTVTQLATGFEQLKGIVEQVLRIVGQAAESSPIHPPRASLQTALPQHGPAPVVLSSPPTSPPVFGRATIDALTTAAAEVVMQTVAQATGGAGAQDRESLAAYAAASVPGVVAGHHASATAPSVSVPLLAAAPAPMVAPVASVFPTSACSSPVLEPRLLAQ